MQLEERVSLLVYKVRDLYRSAGSETAVACLFCRLSRVTNMPGVVTAQCEAVRVGD